MFRKFSLFDSSPPPAKLSINPPSSKSQRKSPLKCAIISTLQLQNAPDITSSSFFLKKPSAKRSKSLDHSNNNDGIKQVYRSYSTTSKCATLPPIVNRELPPPQPTTHRWYTRFGNSIRRGPWSRRDSIVHYQV